MFKHSFLKVFAFFVFFIVFFPLKVDGNYNFDVKNINFCFKQAGYHYNINPNLLWAIAKVESNFNPYALNKNSNGTYDIGIMQINSKWINVLKRYGLKDESTLWDPCYNIYVGAWVLSRCISQFGYTWNAIGCYNAVSYDKKVKYANKIYKTLKPYIK